MAAAPSLSALALKPLPLSPMPPTRKSSSSEVTLHDPWSSAKRPTEEGVTRPRSVQFSRPSSPGASMPRPWRAVDSPSPNGRASDSSPDEVTPIVSQERGSAKDYSTRQASPVLRARNADVSPSVDARQRKASPAAGAAAGSASQRQRQSEPAPAERDEADPGSGKAKPKWWKAMAEKYGSVELDNKGSVARDHLALERTFLAWLRTSLAFASIGIAVTQLFRLNTSINPDGAKPPPAGHPMKQLGKPLGATFLGISILVLLVGGRRYFESQFWIIRGKFPASRGSVALVSAVAAALIVTSLVVVCVVDPTTIR